MKHRSGFTLMELLVVAAVFSILFLVATGVYSNAFGKQKIVQAKQRVSTEARSALETIARTVRVGSIDYNYYKTSCGAAQNGPCDLSVAQTILSVRDAANQQTCFRVNSSDPIKKRLETSTDCSSWTVMSPEDLTVEDFSIWISPIANPFQGPPTVEGDCSVAQNDALNIGFDKNAGVCRCRGASNPGDCWSGQTCEAPSATATTKICKNPNQQPMVTVSFTLKTLPGASYPSESRLQSSVVTRIYQR